MKKISILMILFGIVTVTTAQNPDDLFYTINAHLNVHQPAVTQEELIVWTQNHGGFFLEWTDTGLLMRLPKMYLLDFNENLQKYKKDLTELNQVATDCHDEIQTLQSEITGREDVLKRNLSILNNGDVINTLEIEKEINRLLAELESKKGRLRKLEYDSQFALITVSFGYKKTNKPESVISPFTWLNQIDMYYFLEEMTSYVQ
jgi:hypothetical protein